jgi:hypothetical protein
VSRQLLVAFVDRYLLPCTAGGVAKVLAPEKAPAAAGANTAGEIASLLRAPRNKARKSLVVEVWGQAALATVSLAEQPLWGVTLHLPGCAPGLPDKHEPGSVGATPRTVLQTEEQALQLRRMLPLTASGVL